MVELSVFKDIAIMSTALTGAGLGVYNFVSARRKEYQERLRPRLQTAWEVCKPPIDSDVSKLSNWAEDIREALKEESEEASGGKLFWRRHRAPEESRFEDLPAQRDHLRYHPKSHAAVQKIYRTIELSRKITLEYRRQTLPVTTNANLRVFFPDDLKKLRDELEEEMRNVLREWGFDTDKDIDVLELNRLPAYRRKLATLRAALLDCASLAEKRIAEYRRCVDSLGLNGVISEK